MAFACGMLARLVIFDIMNWQGNNNTNEGCPKNVENSPLYPGQWTGAKWRRVNSFVTDYDGTLNGTLHRIITSGAGSSDPRVLSLIRDLMDPPSGHMLKWSRRVGETPQSREIVKILNRRVGYWFHFFSVLVELKT